MYFSFISILRFIFFNLLVISSFCKNKDVFIKKLLLSYMYMFIGMYVFMWIWTKKQKQGGRGISIILIKIHGNVLAASVIQNRFCYCYCYCCVNNKRGELATEERRNKQNKPNKTYVVHAISSRKEWDSIAFARVFCCCSLYSHTLATN